MLCSRPFAWVVATAFCAGVLAVAPATARPVDGDRLSGGPGMHEPSSPGADKAVRCATQIVAVRPDGRMVLRDQVHRRIGRTDKVTDRRLPLRPTSFVGFDYQDRPRGYVWSYVGFDARGGAPRVVELNVRDASDVIRFTSEKLRNKRFSARLVVNGSSHTKYVVSRNGTLTRWSFYSSRSGRLFLDDPVKIRQGLRGLTTLAISGVWTARNGTVTDQLIGTTRGGSLVQLHIPVDNPKRDRKVIVSKKGFAGVTGLSLGGCTEDRFMPMTTIDAKNDKARYYLIKDRWHPTKRDIDARGRLTDAVDWRLRAVL